MIPGLVYYALDGNRRLLYVKIGYTTSLAQRMVSLKGITSSGQTPLVLALEEGTLEVERERHRQFADLRSHGEWFRYGDDLQKHVAELEHPFAFLLDRPHLWHCAAGWGPLGSSVSSIKPAERSPASESGSDDEDPSIGPLEF